MIEKLDINEKEYVKMMLENDLLAVVYPKDKSEESAKQIVKMVDAAVGVAEFKDEDGKSSWGALINKIKAVKNKMKEPAPKIKKIEVVKNDCSM